MASSIVKAAMAAVVVAGAAVAGYFAWQHHKAPELPSSADIGSETAFAFTECKARLFDGSPAIAVVFTQPLDPKQDFGALLAASEGDAPQAKDDGTKTPPADASFKPLAARWVLADNPRVLYLPYVTPDRSYRVALKADIASIRPGKITLFGRGLSKTWPQLEAAPTAHRRDD